MKTNEDNLPDENRGGIETSSRDRGKRVAFAERTSDFPKSADGLVPQFAQNKAVLAGNSDL